MDYLETGSSGLRDDRPRELVEDPDELALLRAWRVLTPDQQELLVAMLITLDKGFVHARSRLRKLPK